MKKRLTTKLEVRNMVKTKVWASIAIVVVAIVFFFAGFYTQPLIVTETVPKTTWEKILEKGYIEVGSAPDWPPFESLDPDTGEFVGFEVDILEEVMQRLSEEEGVTIDVRWKEMDFAGIKDAVVAGLVDLAVSGFGINPDRCEVVQFTTPHSITEAQIIITKDKAEELGITMLKSTAEIANYGLTTSAETATTEEAEMLDLEAKGLIPEGTYISYERYDLCVMDMMRGAVDTVYIESPISYHWMKAYPGEITIIYRGEPYYPIAFLANKDSDELVSKINGQIAMLIMEGRIAELREKYEIVY